MFSFEPIIGREPECVREWRRKRTSLRTSVTGRGPDQKKPLPNIAGSERPRLKEVTETLMDNLLDFYFFCCLWAPRPDLSLRFV